MRLKFEFSYLQHNKMLLNKNNDYLDTILDSVYFDKSYFIMGFMTYINKNT